MKILHLNIRASQGGAGRMALDLHRRLRSNFVDSHLAYGYGSGIKQDPSVAGDPNITAIGTKLAVVSNYAIHRLCGRDPFTPNASVLASMISACDVIHLHVLHHYYLNFYALVDVLKRQRKRIVATAHDWWYITGRCAIVEQCSGWKRHCGECGPMRWRDLPSVIDRSAHELNLKKAALYSLEKQMTIICPSHHLARVYAEALPGFRIEVIRNAVDLEFEEAVRPLGKEASIDASPRGFLISASDLASPGKVDVALVKRLAQTDTPIEFVGRNSPFAAANFKALGEVRDRKVMAHLLAQSRGLLFTSIMDNAPLTIMEALCAGCYVLAYNSPGTAEMVEMVGGRCVAGLEEMVQIITKNDGASLYGGVTQAELQRRALECFSGRKLLQSYMNTYNQMMTLGI